MAAQTNLNSGQLDSNQILQRGFDESTDRHRVDANVTIDIGATELQVEVDAADGDNIAIANEDGSKKVTVTTIGPKEALDVNIANDTPIDVSITSFPNTVSTPTITNISIPLANTEQSFTFPIGTKRFAVKIRASAKLKIAYISGASGTNYIFIPIGCEYTEDNLDLTVGLPMYFQCESAGEILEIITWN